jgi:proline dehydrogenase
MIDIVQDVLRGLTASQQDQAAIRDIIGQLIALSAKSRSEFSASFETKAFQVELAATLDAVLQKITVDSFISVTQDLLSRDQTAVSSLVLSASVKSHID